jgi:hypothetical protein
VILNNKRLALANLAQLGQLLFLLGKEEVVGVLQVA